MKNLIGQKFGRHLVINFYNKKNNKNYWNCLCDCGNTSIVCGTSLENGRSKSCGCLLKELASKRSFKHGLTKSIEYHSWQAMKDRCLNINSNEYSYYGGRGIKVCNRWVNSFKDFYEDMGKRPSVKHTIERLNNELGYFKENCYWATKKEQANNTRQCKKVINIKTNEIYSSISIAAEKININAATLYNQLTGRSKNKTDLLIIN